MPESVFVQGLGAPTQEVPKGAGGVTLAPLHDTGLVHWPPPWAHLPSFSGVARVHQKLYFKSLGFF